MLGETVKARRDALGWTQDQLAARAEVSRSTVQNLEQGLREPRRASLQRIARALGTDVTSLQRGDVTNEGHPITDPAAGSGAPYTPSDLSEALVEWRRAQERAAAAAERVEQLLAARHGEHAEERSDHAAPETGEAEVERRRRA